MTHKTVQGKYTVIRNGVAKHPGTASKAKALQWAKRNGGTVVKVEKFKETRLRLNGNRLRETYYAKIKKIA